MQITITARRFNLTDELRAYVEEEVSHLQHYYDNIHEADVVLGWEKRERLAEITLSVNGTVLVGHDRSENMTKSIDRAVAKLERQLKKYKGRKKSYTHTKVPGPTVEGGMEPGDQ